MSGSRERKLAGSVRVTAGIVSHRHGYKSRTIPRENWFQRAAEIDGRSVGSPVRPLRRDERGEAGERRESRIYRAWTSASPGDPGDLTRSEILISGRLEALRDPPLRMHRDAASDPAILCRPTEVDDAVTTWLRKESTDVRLYRRGNDEERDNERKSFPAARPLRAGSVKWDSRWNKGPSRAADNTLTSESWST